MLSQLGNAAAASSLVLRMGTDAHLYDDPDDSSIPSSLDSRFDSDKTEALKRLLALIAQGEDVSNLFPKVVKNVASQSLEVKKLVYLYLLHYAEKRQDEALLSINIFQKDLSDTNPLVRAWALRTMAGIRLHIVAPLVLVAIKKCARDPSPYVRKCAAYAIPKLFDLHPEESITMQQILDILLNDNSPGVIGAAAVSFNSVCPDNLSLIAKNYRRLCETVPDVDEWSQIILIKILLRYVVARHGLVKESIIFTDSGSNSKVCSRTSFTSKNSINENNETATGKATHCNLNREFLRFFIGEQERALLQPESPNADDDMLSSLVLSSNVNDDVKILLQCTSPLLWSRNSAVVLAAAGVHWIMAPVDELKLIVNPILFVLRSSSNAAYMILCNILAFVKTAPSLFEPYYEDFFISCSDLYQIRALKLEILSMIATEASIPAIFEEFQDYVRDPDRKFVADTVSAIGLCGQRLQSITNACLDGLLSLILHESSLSDSCNTDGEDGVLVQAILSIKLIIKTDPASHEKVILQLVSILDNIKTPRARALIIWIFGEYNYVGRIPMVVSTILKYLAWSFISEQLETKLQILNTSAKVLLHAQAELDTVKGIIIYIVALAASDINYDLRDRARLYSKLLASDIVCKNLTDSMSSTPPHEIINGSLELLEHIVLHRKTPASILSEKDRMFLPGSLSLIVQHAAPGYSLLPRPCSIVSIPCDPRSETPGMSESLINDIGINSRSHNEYESESVSNTEDSSGNSPRREMGIEYAADLNYNTHLLGVEQNEEVPFAPFLDANHNRRQNSHIAEESISTVISTDLMEMVSKSALESWLDEQPTLPFVQGSEQVPAAKILFTNYKFEVRPKMHLLLDSGSHGLHVLYAFSTDISSVIPSAVTVELLFENVAAEPLLNISIKYEESSEVSDPQYQLSEGISSGNAATSSPIIHPMEEISSLSPHQKIKKLLHVHFSHHLLPIKLALYSNGSRHVTKLWPDIAYFVHPLKMDLTAFKNLESQLLGMFEYTKSCTFEDHLHEPGNMEQNDRIVSAAQSLASKMLSNSNFLLVSMEMPITFAVDDASGLCLQFSGEIVGSSKPCLVSLSVEGKVVEPLGVTVKVNCGDTDFGLNLLNRVAAILQQ